MKKNRHLLYLILALNLVYTEGVFAEAPILERMVTLRAANIPLREALKNISSQAGFYLSYNTNIIDGNKKITFNIESEKVRVVLKSILGNNYQFKEKGDYLIIQKLKTDEQIIGGYISDKKTGKKLPNVTVYDKNTLASATTDSAGYYEIITRKPIQQLSIARYNYGDTVLQVRSEKELQELDVSLLPKIEVNNLDEEDEIVDKPVRNVKNVDKYAERTLISNIEINQAIRWTLNEIERINERNIRESLNRKWQASLAPYVGTNLGLSGNVINNWSLNATVGYSKGNNIFELGGIGNINQGNVKGIQLAGLFNIVKGKTNVLQASMIINRTRHFSGLQISGITNYSDTILRGVQLAGINNYVEFGKKGNWQVGGLVNKTERGRTAFQVSTIANRADTVGVQIGFINNANRLRGIQLGLVNIADTASGVLLGLINIVKKGYHVLEISSNDVTYGNIAYRTGTRWFYTIYTAGGQPKVENKTDILSGGIGIGSSIWFGKVVALTVDMTGHRYWINSKFDNRGGLVKITPALNLQITKRFGISFAPTWNNYFLNSKNQLPADIVSIKNNIVPNKAQLTNDKYQWWGWSAGLRFF
jgi:CarboxypepD_reg-like domain